MLCPDDKYVVDARRENSQLHVALDTATQLAGHDNTVSAFVDGPTICKIAGVGHHALLKGLRMTVGKCHRTLSGPGEDHAMYGFTFTDKDGEPLPATAQAVTYDGVTGASHAFHMIDTPGRAFSDTTMSLGCEPHGPGDEDVYKAITRWRIGDPKPGEQIALMRPAGVDAGVSKLTLSGDSKEHGDKFHVPAGSGIYNLIENGHRKNLPAIAEQYSKDRAITQVINGKPGFIVDEKHFHATNASLKQELGSMDVNNIGKHGMTIQATLINVPCKTPRAIAIPMVFHRELPSRPPGITHDNEVTLAEIDHAMAHDPQPDGTALSLEKAVFKVEDGKNLKATIVPYTPVGGGLT